MPETWKPSRRERRVLLALLSGASNLSGYPLSRTAQVAGGHVYVILARLERQGWVTGEWETGKPEGERRRFYALTPEGRKVALLFLKLED
jgi:PadR family transcriptional regulator, regulatory protein PadR